MPPAVAIGLLAVGTAIQAVGQVQAGRAAAKAGEMNAAAIKEEADVREEQQRFMDQRTMASARAMIGTSGVTSAGSPLLVLAESARRAEMNALNIRRGGQLQAEEALYTGRQARKAGYIGAGGTLLTGGAKLGELL